jgi:hypothetical protein
MLAQPRQESNLILGIAEDLSWQELRPFVESLRRSRFQGDVRLLVAGVGDETTQALVGAGVEVAQFRRLRLPWPGGALRPYDVRLWRLHAIYPKVVRALAWPTRDRTRASAGLMAAVSVPVVGRFLHYYSHLSRCRSRYRNVMLTDVRDVFFQHDPFDFDIGDELVCFLEDERESLGTERRNRNWLRAAFGQSAVDELGDRPISCAGITIGPTPRIFSYLRVMTDWLVRLPHHHFGTDQAVHNYIVHKQLVSGTRLVANDEGVVLTLGIVPQGEVAPPLRCHVVHQYDRHPAVAEALLRTIGI